MLWSREKIESGLKKTGMTLKKILKEVNKEKFFLKKNLKEMKFSLFLIHFHCSFHCCSLCSLVAKLQAGSDCLLSLAVEKKLAGGLR